MPLTAFIYVTSFAKLHRSNFSITCATNCFCANELLFSTSSCEVCIRCDLYFTVRKSGLDSFLLMFLFKFFWRFSLFQLSGDLGLTVAEVNVELCDTEVTGAQDTCYTKRTLDPTGAIVVGSSSPYSIVALRLNIEAVTDELYYRAIAPQRLFNIRDEVCVKNPCKNGGECFSEYGDLSTQTMRYTYR